MMLKSPRTKKQTIRESEVEAAKRRRKYFWLWLRNSRPIVGAFVALMAVVTLVMTPALLDGGNGLVFLGWSVSITFLLIGIFQLIWTEKGYSVHDWAPRAMRGTKYGW